MPGAARSSQAAAGSFSQGSVVRHGGCRNGLRPSQALSRHARQSPVIGWVFPEQRGSFKSQRPPSEQ